MLALSCPLNRLKKKKTYLSQRQVHEWQVVHDGPSNTDNHQDTSSPHHVSRRSDTALDTSALERNARLDILGLSKQLPHSLAVLLSGLGDVDLVGHGRGHHLLGEGQTLGLDVGDDEGVCARGTGGGEGEEADGASSADDDGCSEGDGGRVDAVEDDAQRLEEGTFGEGDVVGEPRRIVSNC